MELDQDTSVHMAVTRIQLIETCVESYLYIVLHIYIVVHVECMLLLNKGERGKQTLEDLEQRYSRGRSVILYRMYSELFPKDAWKV